jgi:hypothetical protein
MRQSQRGLMLASVWLSIAAAPVPALAVPLVYASVADDGANSGIAQLSADSLPVSLSLYLDPGELAYEYVVGFETSPGLGVLSFAAEDPTAVVNFDAATGTLALTASLGAGTSDPVRIGTLMVFGTAAGGELRLADLPDASTPFLTNADFGLTPIPVPQTIAVVRGDSAPIPEPDARLLLWAGALVVGRALRRQEPAQA